jgi:Na+-driven multidrug efflux pump
MGVRGAALATVISQAVSAVWILHFLMGEKTPLRLKRQNICIIPEITKNILKLGTSNFVMQGTTCFVQAACNSTLQIYGGDVYIGIMTVLNSIRDIFMLPIHGLISGAQPVMGFNYGAGKNDRVKAAIRFNTLAGAVYTLAAWLLVFVFPEFWFRIFSKNTDFLEYGVSAMRIYFFGFVFMSFQFAGQSVFQALGDSKHAIFFSLLRKAIIVIPLTLLLPRLGMGVRGVFIAEPISNIVGGLACFITMRYTIYKKLT